MGLGRNERSRVRRIAAKSTTPTSARDLAACTGYDLKDIRRFLKEEKVPRTLHRKPAKPQVRCDYYKRLEAVKHRRTRLQEIIERELADCPPGRDPSEHRRIVEAVYGL